MRAKLTKRSIEAIEAPAKGKIICWDTDLRGFGLSVNAGGTRSFILNYRIHGIEKRFLVGRFGEITVDEARRIAADKLRDVRHGMDPQGMREAARRVRKLADFWPEYVKHAQARWKKSTAEENERRWTKHIEPALGHLRLDQISKKDISSFHRGMDRSDLGEGAEKQKGRVQANRSLALLKSILNVAVEFGIIPINPAIGLDPFPEKSRERFLSEEETKRLFEAIAEEEKLWGKPSLKRAGEAEKGRRGGKGLKETESRGISLFAAGLFRLLLFTGARLSEIRDAEWQWWNRELGCIELPDSKTGAKRIWLNSPAIDELIRLWNTGSRGRFIIEGRTPGESLNNANKAWDRVRIRAGISDLRIHDLRHSFASFGVLNGVPLQVVGKALGHAQARTTERYAHIANDPARLAAEQIGAAIERARSGSATIMTVQSNSVEVSNDEPIAN